MDEIYIVVAYYHGSHTDNAKQGMSYSLGKANKRSKDEGKERMYPGWITLARGK